MRKQISIVLAGLIPAIFGCVSSPLEESAPGAGAIGGGAPSGPAEKQSDPASRRVTAVRSPRSRLASGHILVTPFDGSPELTGTDSSSGGGGTCAGIAVALTLDTPMEIDGTTSAGIDSNKTFCADPDGSTTAPDVMYAIDIPAACTLSISLASSGGLQGAYELRPVCDQEAASYCISATDAASNVVLPVEPGTYYLVVDGANGTSGDFAVSLSCQTAACGDGVINSGEDCDGGPGITDGDGCGDPGTPSACLAVFTPAADNCSDVTPMVIDNTGPFTLPASDTPYDNIFAHDDFQCSSPDCWTAPSRDQVFAFTPTQDGTLSITVGNDLGGTPSCLDGLDGLGCWNHGLYVRAGDCSSTTDITDSWPTFNGDDGVNDVTFAASAGITYYVYVDGWDMTQYDVGPYFLQVDFE